METIAFTKTKLPYGWLGNMSPYPIKFGEHAYPTTEALFQALRFTDPEIQKQIREEKGPMAAKLLAKSQVEDMVIEQLSDKDVANMKMCLRLKLEQYPNLKEELLKTDKRLIVEDVTNRGDKGSNLFWGAMLVEGEWQGKNVLGNLWMELREELIK